MDFVLLGAAATMIGCQLFIPPIVGMPDNGDWGKVLGHYGLTSGTVASFISTRFQYLPEGRYRSHFGSSAHAVVAPALLIGRWISSDGSFDLRVIGAFHAALYLAAMFLFLRRCNSVVAGAVAVFLFCDFFYVVYLNSFYMDAIALLFTCLSVALYVQCLERRRALFTAALFVAMVMATLSKTQYAFLGLWFAILFWMAKDALVGGRRVLAAGAAAALVCAAAISAVDFRPDSYPTKGAFSLLFARIAPESGDPDRVLAEFGLDPSSRQWVGRTAYMVGGLLDEQVTLRPLSRKVSYSAIARYYVAHPRETWNALVNSLSDAGQYRNYGGNFDLHSGKQPMEQYDGFQWSSALHRRLLYGHGLRFLGVFLALAMLTIAVCWRMRDSLPAGSVPGAVVLAGIGATALTISTLADVFEIRHYIIFLAVFDMQVVAAVWLCREAALRYKLRKWKPPSTLST